MNLHSKHRKHSSTARFVLTNLIIVALLSVSLPVTPAHAKKRNGSWWKRNIARPMESAAAVSLEMGDGFIANTFEARVNAGLGNVTTQAAENSGLEDVAYERSI